MFGLGLNRLYLLTFSLSLLILNSKQALETKFSYLFSCDFCVKSYFFMKLGSRIRKKGAPWDTGLVHYQLQGINTLGGGTVYVLCQA